MNPEPTSVSEVKAATVGLAAFFVHQLKFGVAPDVYRVSVVDIRADGTTVATLIGNYPAGIPHGGLDTALAVFDDWVEVEHTPFTGGPFGAQRLPAAGHTHQERALGGADTELAGRRRKSRR